MTAIIVIVIVAITLLACLAIYRLGVFTSVCSNHVFDKLILKIVGWAISFATGTWWLYAIGRIAGKYRKGAKS